MGLGPPICTKCEIMLYFNNEIKLWYCPKCGEDFTTMDKIVHLWQMPNFKQIEKNTEKYNEEKRCLETKIKKK